jgi:hypothetical protein
VAVIATAPQSATLDVGDEWVIGVAVFDDDGTPVSATVAVAVTDPAGAGSTPTATEDSTGYYSARATLASAGRYLAVVTVSGTVVGVQPFTAFAEASTDADGMPSLTQVLAYLELDADTTGSVAEALAAETAAQRKACDVPAVYGADLAEALKRRVARNLAARAVPIATFTSFEGGGTSARVPQVDAEIARLEAPYRSWVIA